MLIAVNTFYQGDYEGATSAIADVMRKSSMFEFTERMDQLRIIIYTREKNIPIEALKHLNDGRKAEEDGATEKAIEHYKDAMLIAEDYAPAALALGKLYDRTGDSYTANNFFQKAIAADSQYYSAYHSLYKNYFKNASYKPMIELLTQAIASGNEYFDFYYYLGIACNGAADYTQAIQYYERALMLNDKSIDANIQAGISYQNMKSYPKAREYYTKAIALDPENQTATESLKLLDELQKKF
jgi:tetratricopeptide (TPR) repeat protein